MPPTEPVGPDKSLEEVVEEVGLYPIQAYEFIQQGLGYTVNKLHGPQVDREKKLRPGGAKGQRQQRQQQDEPSRHVGGRELCEGLREFALSRWGLMARTVLERWNIRRTIDFGRIVFALVDSGMMQKTDQDTIEDFRDVYDFKKVFDGQYRIESKV